MDKKDMDQEEIIDPAASLKPIFQINRAKLTETTLNSKQRCLRHPPEMTASWERNVKPD
jgi:hypothetical protein